MCVRHRANQHLGEEGWGLAEQATVCPGRSQGRGSVAGRNTVSLLKETLGQAIHPLWPQVSLHQRYRATQVKPNRFQWTSSPGETTVEVNGLLPEKDLLKGVQICACLHPDLMLGQRHVHLYCPKRNQSLKKKPQHHFSQCTAISKACQSGHT